MLQTLDEWNEWLYEFQFNSNSRHYKGTLPNHLYIWEIGGARQLCLFAQWHDIAGDSEFSLSRSFAKVFIARNNANSWLANGRFKDLA
jgi:hypothetical protein